MPVAYRRRRDPSFRAAFLTALGEYALIVSPVALYVLLCSLPHDGLLAEMLLSPEWNIATMFLVAQGQTLHRTRIEETGRKPFHPATTLIMIGALTIIVMAATTTHYLLASRAGAAALVAMWALFLIASVLFFLFVVGANLLIPSGGTEQCG